jgi:RNA polymerase sigma-70 factor (ECF subfamily)
MSDREILDGLIRGDADAAAGLVDQYGDRLLRSAFALCGNASDAQDLAQETLLQAVKSAHRCRGTSSIYTWLHGILLNVTHRFFRKQKRLTYMEEVPEQNAPEPAAGTGLDTDVTSATVLQALDALSYPHREVIVLRYFEELPVCEIAEQVKVTQGTVKSRIHYALRRLRELVSEELNDFTS